MRLGFIGWRKAGLLVLVVTTVAISAIACLENDDGDEDTPATSTASTGASGELAGDLNIEGSSTVAPYTRLAIEAFEELHADVTVTTGDAGSGEGIAAFIDKEVPIAASSRQITEDERRQAEAADLEVHETKIFDDALVIVLNPGNKVVQLTVDQVAGIFAGEIKDWSEVGGDPGAIKVYGRNDGSGTSSYMGAVIKDVLGDGATQSPDVNRQQSAQAGLTAVQGDRSGIFYAGLGNIAELPQGAVKVLGVAKDASSQPVIPSEATVKSGQYPLVHGLYYYTDGDPAQSGDPLTQAFIEFVLSPDGQALGSEIGLVPVN